jgi:hypothetical protein
MTNEGRTFGGAVMIGAGLVLGSRVGVTVFEGLGFMLRHGWQMLKDYAQWRANNPDKFDACVLDNIRPHFYSPKANAFLQGLLLTDEEAKRIKGKMFAEYVKSLPTPTLARLEVTLAPRLLEAKPQAAPAHTSTPARHAKKKQRGGSEQGQMHKKTRRTIELYDGHRARGKSIEAAKHAVAVAITPADWKGKEFRRSVDVAVKRWRGE